jgi:hypothetical protein
MYTQSPFLPGVEVFLVQGTHVAVAYTLLGADCSGPPSNNSMRSEHCICTLEAHRYIHLQLSYIFPNHSLKVVVV